MKSRIRLITVFILGVQSASANAADVAIPNALERYVARPEAEFEWSLKSTAAVEGGRIHRLHLVSQKWHDIVWEHALTVYEPAKVEYPGHMLLFVTGGSTGREPGKKDHKLGLQLATACGAAVAMLPQVPNQPLLGDRKEDDLITETWLRYLDTGDTTWPLLFPMVKSAVKAMDALQEFSEQKLSQKVESFVITGASKRGWTSWLTPVADRRVVATAPIVIDVLNFLAQMKNQRATWGKYSEQIHDYSSKGLIKTSADEESPRERRLRLMMDPYTYRSRLTLPKLMIVGTNDPYWVVDAMNIYWDDLSGPKYVLQVPNAGHDLGDGREEALNTLSVYFQHIAGKVKMPQLEWNAGEDGGKLTLRVDADVAPERVRLWSATALKRDFRESKWTAKALELNSKSASGSVEVPENGAQVAVFGEATFRFKDRPYSLTTLVYRK